jgi:hypothetical protein
MSAALEIKKQKQKIARLEQELAAEKLKKRRADTRNKIQLGGLVIKSEMSFHDKDIILGALIHAFNNIQEDESCKTFFSSLGKNAFLGALD